MAKRKINVEQLNDEQQAQAEKKISERINGAMDLLTAKWVPLMKNHGINVRLQYVIDTESGLSPIKKQHEDFFQDYESNILFNKIAKDLNEISKNMTVDLNNAVEHCNELLSRYGMACDMAFVNGD